jgi:hypothetical protein
MFLGVELKEREENVAQIDNITCLEPVMLRTLLFD